MELNGLNDSNGPVPELSVDTDWEPSGNAAACVAWYARSIDPVESDPEFLELIDPLLEL
jgi:hypothetical protein